MPSDPAGLPPFPFGHLDYRDEPLSNFLPLLRTICILVILLESTRAWLTCLTFYPYLSGRASLPASYPSPLVEYTLNAIPIGVGLFGIAAAAIGLGSAGGMRVLIVWSWCQIVASVLGMGFNAIYVLSHIASTNKQWAGYYVAAELSELCNRLIAQVALPITIIAMRRLIRARRS